MHVKTRSMHVKTRSNLEVEVWNLIIRVYVSSKYVSFFLSPVFL